MYLRDCTAGHADPPGAAVNDVYFHGNAQFHIGTPDHSTGIAALDKPVPPPTPNAELGKTP